MGQEWRDGKVIWSLAARLLWGLWGSDKSSVAHSLPPMAVVTSGPSLPHSEPPFHLQEGGFSVRELPWPTTACPALPTPSSVLFPCQLRVWLMLGQGSPLSAMSSRERGPGWMADFSKPSPTLQSPSPACALSPLRLYLGFVQNEEVKVPFPQVHYTQGTAVYTLVPHCFGHASSWGKLPREHRCLSHHLQQLTPHSEGPSCPQGCFWVI